MVPGVFPAHPVCSRLPHFLRPSFMTGHGSQSLQGGAFRDPNLHFRCFKSTIELACNHKQSVKMDHTFASNSGLLTRMLLDLMTPLSTVTQKSSVFNRNQ